MTDKPPPFAKYLPVSGDDIWKKILSGEVAPHIYSSKAKGDFEPVPISPAEFFTAEQAGRDEDGELDRELKPYQIMWRDRDHRRPAAIRYRVPAAHWVYVMKADLPAPKKERTGPGAAEQYDWDDIEQFIRREFINRGDFADAGNRVKGWRSQNDLIELIKDYLERRKQPIPQPTRFKEKVAEILLKLRSELAAGH